jgi:hypothetical protein
METLFLSPWTKSPWRTFCEPVHAAGTLCFSRTREKVHKISIYNGYLEECEIWSLSLREEFLLRTVCGGILRIIFVPRTWTIMENYRKLVNESVITCIVYTWSIFILNCRIKRTEPIPVATRSMAWVCGRSLAGIVGSSAVGSMDACRL